MPDKAERDGKPQANNDAAGKSLAREKAVPDKKIPVKQHTPGDKGLNPGQKGPAQPSGSAG